MGGLHLGAMQSLKWWIGLVVMLVLCRHDSSAQNIYETSAVQQPSPSAATSLTADNGSAQAVCPGISGGVCGTQCQLHICKALGRFYKATLNETDPWDNEQGWELTASTSCEQLVGAGAAQAAVYCNWWGITCCTPSAIAAGNCSTLNIIHAVELPINNLNASVANTSMVEPLQQLHDCGMRILDLEANNFVNFLSPAWGSLVHLTTLNLGNCWIDGTIPDTLRNLRNLTNINLSNNFLNGTLPPWLDELKQLQTLKLGTQLGGNEDRAETGFVGHIPQQLSNLRLLRELNLELNGLTGTLPANLCNGDRSNLLVLNVMGNQLSGIATVVESCGSLVQLDISNNDFEGPLPASKYWSELSSYRANNNRFTGPLPLTLPTYARILERLELSNNLLTGKFPNQITLLSGLKNLYIAGNKFSGTLTEDVFFMPNLLTFDVSNNSFVGTIPDSIGLAYSLQVVDYSNNPGITGRIPPQMGLLQDLQIARLEDTSLSCSGIIRPYNVTTNASCSDPVRCTTPQYFGDWTAHEQVCAPDQQLPCFLHFTDYLIPREDDSNMRCRYIVRLPQEKAIAACGGLEPTDLADYAEMLPQISSESYDQGWFVDPSYYQYQACECLVGYAPVWDEHHTVLECLPQDISAWVAYKRTAVIVGTIAGVLVLGLLVLVWRQYLTTRPRWLRQRIMQAKRTKGAPKCAKQGDKVTVSIVVTDVKDFSELTRKCPELMNKAMGGHNNILRKACHAHAGYIMDQEGDSWTIAFHDAEDAVAFGLQVQQALAHKVWGMRLGGNDAALDELCNLRDEGFSTKYVSAIHTSSAALGHNMHTSSRESSVNAAPSDRAAAAASAQQAILQDGPGSNGHLAAIDSNSVHRAGPSFTGPSFSSYSWPGQASSAGSHTDFNQLVQATNSADAAAAGRLFAGWLGKLVRSEGSHSSSQQQHPEHVTLSFTDAAGQRDTGVMQQVVQKEGKDMASNTALPQVLQHGAVPRPSGAPVIPSGNSWDSAKATEAAVLNGHAHAPLKSSIESSLQYWKSGGADVRGGDSSSTACREDRSSSKLWTSALMRRISHFAGGRSGSNQSKFGQLTSEQAPMQVVRLAVRIGVATGQLQHGTDVNNCTVKDRAKELVSDVANGGQVLVDENTFLIIKDSLSVLGTVGENGYDDILLQQQMQAQVLDKFQQHAGCVTCVSHRQRSMSFSSDVLQRDHQDYDNDAIVVHMGCFEVPGSNESEESSHAAPSPKSITQIEMVMLPAAAPAAKAAPASKTSATQKLHLYSVAAPGMRLRASNTQELSVSTAWTEPVNAKTGWVQLQKGYFDAPGARLMDLSPSNALYHSTQAPLPDVTIVFAVVAGANSLTFKRSRSDAQYVNKVVTRCMLEQLAALPGGDGYLCRVQEADLKYMIAFEYPHKAVQWCLAVQEALMYFDWPASILSHPGFEEVIDVGTGLPLFRGPRIRMGLAEGQPNSVIPDHNGRANYYGGSVNRAARYMDAAAHGGQLVTDITLLRKLISAWAAGDAADAEPQASDVQEACATATEALQGQQFDNKLRATGNQQVEQLLQVQLPLQQQCRCKLPLSAPRSPGSVAGSEVGALPILPIWTRKAQILSPGSHDSDGLLEPARRSRSETFAARQVKFNLGPHALLVAPCRGGCNRSGSSSSSFTYGTRFAGVANDMRRSITQQIAEVQPAAAGGYKRAGLKDVAEAGLHISLQEWVDSPVCEPVHAHHVGTFTFKGSGEYEMVSVMHHNLERRSFPAEPPKGKGQRVVDRTGLVEGLPQVQLQIRQGVLAARRAFLSKEM